jgi:hypothetical protein
MDVLTIPDTAPMGHSHDLSAAQLSDLVSYLQSL